MNGKNHSTRRGFVKNIAAGGAAVGGFFCEQPVDETVIARSTRITNRRRAIIDWFPLVIYMLH